MKQTKIDIADAVRRMEKAGELAIEAEILAAAKDDPLKAIIELNKAVEEWEKSEPSSLIQDNPKFVKFVKQMSRQLTTEIYVVMRHTISQLYRKLQEADRYIQPKELSSILNELGRQVAVLQKVDETQLSVPSETELDKQIRELEKELGAASGGTRYSR